jgi:hypothetical protein
MWHVTWTQVNQGDFQLLVVKSQIDSWIHGTFFGHNFCFKYSNGSCDPILHIYVSRDLQWYKFFFNPMSFDPWNRSLNFLESIKTPTPKVGDHLGMCGLIPSHFPTFLWTWDVTRKLHSRPTPLQALVLIASLRLGSQHCIRMNVCCWKLVCLGISHQNVLLMLTFHTPPIGIMQHNGVYFVVPWICRFRFCLSNCQKFAMGIILNELPPNP